MQVEATSHQLLGETRDIMLYIEIICMDHNAKLYSMAKFLLVEPFGPTAIWAIRTVRFADSALVDLRNYYTACRYSI